VEGYLEISPSFQRNDKGSITMWQQYSFLVFWQDNWNGQELKSLAPELYSFAKNKLITVQKVREQGDFIQLLHLPISEEAFEQMQQLLQILGSLTITEDKDIWRYIWGENFSSSRAYMALMGHH